MPMLLASGSPRRRELIALMGLPVEACAVEADESPRPGENGRDLTRRLARQKAEAVGQAPGVLVLAADTCVVDGGELLGKPRHAAEARAMLERLRGRQHTVVTSIAVRAPDGRLLVDTCESRVPMRPYSDQAIQSYLDSGSPFDKAGGYGIQDGFEPVEMSAFSDCFANVMGLPLCHATRTLRRLGAEPASDVPAACAAHTGYACRVYPAILRGEA